MVDLVLASDVDNPLTGPKGAPAVYGPQKGASPDDVTALDAALVHYAKVLEQAIGPRAAEHAASPGAGAAGGIGYGALVLGAASGPVSRSCWTSWASRRLWERVSLVITGEGSLDTQTLHGKAPAGVAAGGEGGRQGGRRGLRPAGAAARDTGPRGIRRAYPLTELEPDVAKCIADAGPILQRVAENIARTSWSDPSHPGRGTHGCGPAPSHHHRSDRPPASQAKGPGPIRSGALS